MYLLAFIERICAIHGYIYVHMSTYVCLHGYIYVYISTCLHICLYVYIYMCICLYVYIYMSTCLHIYVYKSISLHVYLHVYMSTYAGIAATSSQTISRPTNILFICIYVHLFRARYFEQGTCMHIHNILAGLRFIVCEDVGVILEYVDV